VGLSDSGSRYRVHGLITPFAEVIRVRTGTECVAPGGTQTSGACLERSRALYLSDSARPSTDAQGVATLDNASLAGITIGTHSGAIGASFAGDDEFPAMSGSGSLTVIDVPTPGLMIGDGFVLADNRYAFNFLVSETANSDDRGAFSLRVTDARPKPKGKPRDDRFTSRTYTNVRFIGDTVLFAGTGEWNGQGGYRFEAFAQDGGEPGRGSDTLRVTIYDSANQIILQFDDALAGGNVQSVRLRH
jgi:hypothetical protein